MDSPQFKSGNLGVFNQKISLAEFKCIDSISIFGLYISETLLFLGILLVLFNNLDIIAPGSYFGAFSWVTVVVFSIGLCINFVAIPFLYFSGLKNFIKENDFWDKETFWILPLFFFGTFFLYNSLIATALALLVISIVIIAIIHIKVIIEAQKISDSYPDDAFASRGQYVITLKYLTVYYVLLLLVLVFIDPLRLMFAWIRMNV